MFFERVIKRR